jgi:uncharacterized protein YbjQ (UPF0145 family)
MSLKLFTTDNFDEKAYSPLGFVRGTMVHSVSMLRDFVGNVTAIFGGVNAAINKKIDDTYDEAIKELVKYTKTNYPSATAIGGINVSLTEMKDFIICVACGTALGPNTSSSSSSSSSTELVNPNAPLTPKPPIRLPIPQGGFSKYSKNKTKRIHTNTKRYTKRHR